MSYPVMSTSVPWSLVKSGFKKTPHFNSVTQKSGAGRRSSFSLQPYATWDFELDLNYVLGGEAIANSVLQSFLGCFMACSGGCGFFLFTDPNDNTVGLEGIDTFLTESGDSFTLESGSGALVLEDSGLRPDGSGILLNVTPGAANPMQPLGDGESTKFQLARLIDQGVDILQNVTISQVTVNGVGTSAYTVSETGVITFAVAPPAGATLAWAGTFRYLCQFTDDSLKDLARVSKNGKGFLWSCSAVAFESLFVDSNL